jgi:hypothetical protein
MANPLNKLLDALIKSANSNNLVASSVANARTASLSPQGQNAVQNSIKFSEQAFSKIENAVANAKGNNFKSAAINAGSIVSDALAKAQASPNSPKAANELAIALKNYQSIASKVSFQRGQTRKNKKIIGQQSKTISAAKELSSIGLKDLATEREKKKTQGPPPLPPETAAIIKELLSTAKETLNKAFQDLNNVPAKFQQAALIQLEAAKKSLEKAEKDQNNVSAVMKSGVAVNSASGFVNSSNEDQRKQEEAQQKQEDLAKKQAEKQSEKQKKKEEKETREEVVALSTAIMSLKSQLMSFSASAAPLAFSTLNSSVKLFYSSMAELVEPALYSMSAIFQALGDTIRDLDEGLKSNIATAVTWIAGIVAAAYAVIKLRAAFTLLSSGIAAAFTLNPVTSWLVVIGSVIAAVYSLSSAFFKAGESMEDVINKAKSLDEIVKKIEQGQGLSNKDLAKVLSPEGYTKYNAAKTQEEKTKILQDELNAAKNKSKPLTSFSKGRVIEALGETASIRGLDREEEFRKKLKNSGIGPKNVNDLMGKIEATGFFKARSGSEKQAEAQQKAAEIIEAHFKSAADASKIIEEALKNGVQESNVEYAKRMKSKFAAAFPKELSATTMGFADVRSYFQNSNLNKDPLELKELQAIRLASERLLSDNEWAKSFYDYLRGVFK